jgi:RHS repeat-associated protein
MGYWYLDNTNSSLSHTATYSYDGVNRLSTAVATGNSTYNLTFGYDAYGNMACETKGQTNGPCPNWTFNGNNQINTSGFSYDAAGHLTADGTHTYQWDGEGRMSQIDGGATQTWAYNALGQWVHWQTGGWPQYLYDPWGRDIAYFDAGGGTWLDSMVPLGGRYLASYPGSYWGNVMGFGHVNALGSETQDTEYNGAVTRDALFYPWGQFWVSRGLFASFSDVDSETIGFDVGRARNYNYTQGRWMTPDPLGGDITNPQSLNRYAYVMNNPTTFIDPLGLLMVPPGMGGGGGGCDPSVDPDCGCDPSDPECGGGGGCDPSIDPDCHPWPPGGGGGGGGGGGAGGNGQFPPGTTPVPPGQGPVGTIYDPMAPCGRDASGEPLPCWGFPWWTLGLGAAPVIYVTVTARAPQTPPHTKPGCFGVFLSATAKAWLIPSLNPSTGFSMASYAAVPAWSWAASKSVGIRAAFNFFRVPAQFAAQAAAYARVAATLERAVPVLQLLSLIAAEGQGLSAEWNAATSGACQGVF